MPRNTLIVVLLVIFASIATVHKAFAEDNNPFYVGIEGGYIGMKHENGGYDRWLSGDVWTGTIFAGLQTNKHVAIEVGYLHSKVAEGYHFSTATRKTKIQGPHFDIVANYEFLESNRLLGSLGLGAYKIRMSGLAAIPEHRHVVLRLGAGFEHDLSDRLAARAMFRYLEFSDTQQARMSPSYNIGLSYRF